MTIPRLNNGVGGGVPFFLSGHNEEESPCGSLPSPAPPLKRTAVHEASHVVWLFLRGMRIEKVSVEPNGKSEGRVTMPEGRQQFVDPPPVSAKPDRCTMAVTQAAVLLSGPAGVAVLTGSRALSDEPEILEARDILAEAYPRITVGCTLNDIWRCLCDRLAYPPVWAGVEALAHRLLQDRTIDYTTAHIIVHDAMVKAAEHQPTEHRRNRMTYIRSPFDLLHGAPPGLAVLADGESEIALARVTALKRAAFLTLIRKRLRIRNPQPKKRED